MKRSRLKGFPSLHNIFENLINKTIKPKPTIQNYFSTVMPDLLPTYSLTQARAGKLSYLPGIAPSSRGKTAYSNFEQKQREITSIIELAILYNSNFEIFRVCDLSVFFCECTVLLRLDCGWFVDISADWILLFFTAR